MTDEAPSAQATVTPNQAHLGDLITLDIRVTHPPELTVAPPAFSQPLGNFEVHSSTTLAADRSGPKWIDHYQAQLQDFATGQQVLPGIEVNYSDPMGKTGKLKTPELTVTIETVPPGPKDKGDIRGIKGVIGPIAASPWWWVLAAVLLSALGYQLWRTRKRTLQGPPPAPPVPPDEAALKKLRDLEASGWLEAGQIKEFYSALSDIVRAYIEAAFKTPALERTTSELLRDLHRKGRFSSQQQVDLRNLLEDCDLVKFAKFRPDAADGLKLHALAVKFVQETFRLSSPSAATK